MSQDFTGLFKILLSDSDTLSAGRSIQVSRVAGQGFFLLQLLDEEKKPLSELSQKATLEGNRFVDGEAGLEVVHVPNGLAGRAFLLGSVTGLAVNRSIFVAEDDGRE
jgi:hypothetical protein